MLFHDARSREVSARHDPVRFPSASRTSPVGGSSVQDPEHHFLARTRFIVLANSLTSLLL